MKENGEHLKYYSGMLKKLFGRYIMVMRSIVGGMMSIRFEDLLMKLDVILLWEIIDGPLMLKPHVHQTKAIRKVQILKSLELHESYFSMHVAV